MFSIALTGGIATGKSTFARTFRALAPGTVFFDCDACVHALMTEEDVKQEIVSAFGPVQAADGSLDRSRLRELVFDNAERRHTLEGILHPRVRAACMAAQEAAAAAQAEFFLADVPLLYESGFPVPRDLEVVVATTPEEQRQRLMARSRLTPEMVDRILAAQLPLSEKMRRAGVVIWNGGAPVWLSHQTAHLVAWLRRPVPASAPAAAEGGHSCFSHEHGVC